MSSRTLFIILILLGAVLVLAVVKPLSKPLQKDYSELLKDVQAGRVTDLRLNLARGEGVAVVGGTEFRVIIPDDPELPRRLSEMDTTGKMNIRIQPRGFADSALANLSWLIFPAVMAFIFYMWMKQMQATGGQALSFGRSRARRFSEMFEPVTFDDVAGVEEAKEELQEVVEFLKDPARFRALGAKIPKGVLLLGPPGCGKTLLARAIAGEAKVPFFYISGSDFVEMFVGVGASRVRDLFDQAKQHTPCIVFIDEIDAVGRQRGAGLGGGHDEREQTLNQLLVEMDGFDPNLGIILVAATNRPDILDPALLRPGRFDRRIVVDQADIKGRQRIFEIYLRNKPLEVDVDAEALARRTPGFSGADIENLVNEAALLAARQNAKKVSMAHFEAAVDRLLAGPERKSRVISPVERRITAYHEAGHALVGKLLPEADPVQKVSIVSRGMTLGFTMQMPQEDRYLYRRSQLLDRVTSRLGGRGAESLVFGDVSTGAGNDLELATDLVRSMVCEFGMSENLGPLTYGRKHGPVFLGRAIVEERNYSEEVARAIDQEVSKIIKECYDRALKLLNENRPLLEGIAEALLEKETLDSEELDRILESLKQPEPVAAENAQEPPDAAAPLAAS